MRWRAVPNIAVIAGPDPAIQTDGIKRMYVYILANRRNGTLYIGLTNDLVRRVWEHREGVADGFTKRYEINSLVYFEKFDDPTNAIQREKT